MTESLHPDEARDPVTGLDWPDPIPFRSRYAPLIRASSSPFRMGVALYMIGRTSPAPNAAYMVAQFVTARVVSPAAWNDVAVGREEVSPFLELGRDAAQNLMDELWRLGIRPTEVNRAEAEAPARLSHIADLQRVAFGLLDHVTGDGPRRTGDDS